MDTLPISVVVVARNSEKTLDDCLEAIKQNLPAEIILVDGKSTDKTLAIARKYTNNILINECNRISTGRQIGFEQATQAYVSYVDSDVILSSSALRTMLKEMIEQRWDHIYATIFSVNHNTYWERAADCHFKFKSSKINAGLAASILKHKVIKQIGFDSKITGAGEDMDFIFRFKTAGFKSYLSPIPAYHYHRSDFKSFAKQRFFYGRGKSDLIKKYGMNKIEFWPPIYTIYWLCFCIHKHCYWIIPYFILNGIFEISGMIMGIYKK